MEKITDETSLECFGTGIVLEKCENCILKLSCAANFCHVNNYILHKDFAANPDCWCWWNALLLEKAQFVLEVLGYHKNKFFRDYLEKELTSQGGPFHYVQ